MRYTLWSRGRLLGETDLGFVFRPEGFRCGWLYPTTLGERVLPRATGVGPALRTVAIIGPDPTARADLLAAIDEETALELELRGPRGAVIATEHIHVVDTHYLIALAQANTDEDIVLDAEEEAEVEELIERLCPDDDTWTLELGYEEELASPRYHLQVTLVDWGAVP